MIEIDIQMFPHHPIRKLLVPINQSSYLICFCYNFFDIAKETNMYEIKSRRLRSEILACFIFLVLFSIKSDCIDIGYIGNLEDSPRFVHR